jgi:hypothetical protein
MKNPLLPYTKEESKTFFGRDVEIRHLISSLQACRLTITYGDSKVGLTSLLQAGVYAQLQQQSNQSLITPSHNEESTGANEANDLPIYLDYQNIYEILTLPSTDFQTTNLYKVLATILVQALEGEGSTCSVCSSTISTQNSFIELLKECSITYGEQIRMKTIYLIIDHTELALLRTHDKTCFFRDIMVPVLQYPEIRFNFLLAFRKNSVIMLDRFKKYRDFLENRYEVKPLERDVVQSSILQKSFFSCHTKTDDIINAIIKYQSLASKVSCDDQTSSIFPTYLQLALHSFNSQPRPDLDLEEILKEYILNHFSEYNSNNEVIIAAYIINYISSVGSENVLTAKHLVDLIFQDPYLFVNVPFTDPQLALSMLDEASSIKYFYQYSIAVLAKLDQSRIVTKHGSSYEIHADFQLALSKWKDSVLSTQAQYNAGRASSIASQSNIISMQLAQSMEMELARNELSGLLALQAYSYSKYANVDYKLAIFDEAFRNFLQYPYSIRELRIRSGDKSEVSAVALSSNSKRIATVDSSGQIKIYESSFASPNWKSNSLKPYIVKSQQGTATSIVFHPECENILVIGYKTGAVEYCLLNKDMTKSQLYQCKSVSDPTNCELPEYGVGPGPIAFNHNGTWLAFGGWDKKVTLWKLNELLPDQYNEFKPTFNGDYCLANMEFCDD